MHERLEGWVERRTGQRHNRNKQDAPSSRDAFQKNEADAPKSTAESDCLQVRARSQ